MPDAYTLVAWAAAALAFALGVQILGVGGLFFALVVVLLAVTGAAGVLGRRTRRALNRRDPRFKPTSEVFRDTRTGATMRVHVDSATGERRYWADH
jgi:membrane protein implicated in regulation of membrane protease activity